MQLMLYDKRQTDFTMNGDPIHHVFDAHVVRDEGFYLKFKLLLDKDKKYQKVQKEMIIGAKTPDGVNQFRVFDVNPQSDHVEVIALHLFYYLDHRLLKPFSVKDVTGSSIISIFKNNFVSSISPYTFDSSVTETHDFMANTQLNEDGYLNALEVIQRIAKRWDSEFLLNGFDVRMVKRLGKKTNALLHEKKNISSFESEETISSLVTRIYAKSTWTLDHDDPDYVEGAKGDENKREIKVTVDSPLISEYSQVYEKEYINNDCRTEQELINWAKLKYTTDQMDKPRRSIEVKTNIIDGTVINYGDDLVLKYILHDVDEVIRCVGYDYDPLSEEHYGITLGDWRDTFGKSMNRAVSDVSERQKSEIERLNKEVQTVQMAANGINRFTSGPQPVPNPIDGDLWFYYEYNRPNEVEMRVYDGVTGLWKRKDITSEEVRIKFQELESSLQSAQEDINKAKQDLLNIELLPGDSAYQIALKHGFEGTEEEWLKSLEPAPPIQGPAGTDGKTFYTWVKYADNDKGLNMSDYPTATTQYIGIATNKETPTESINYADYQWTKTKGDQGVPGKDGSNGKTLYTWIKYADTETGQGMSDDPTGKKYIGFAYNKETPTKSNTHTDYQWSAMYDMDALNKITLKLDELSQQAEMMVSVTGNDKEMIFSDNRLDTDINGDDWSLSLEEGTKDLKHNGSGYDVTQGYHFRTIVKYVPRIHSQVRIEFEVI